LQGEEIWEQEMSLTFIQPSKHLVRDTEVTRMFRRRLRCPDIMTFFSGETGQWILARWVDKGKRLVEEMEDLGPIFNLVTPELVSLIVSCYRPVDWGEHKRRLLSRQKDRLVAQQEEVIQDQERWDWLKKKMQRPLPYAFNSPISGGQPGMPVALE
jgi:hypothetical protein